MLQYYLFKTQFKGGFNPLNFDADSEKMDPDPGHEHFYKEHKEMESERDPNVGPPDRRQMWEAPSSTRANFSKTIFDNLSFFNSPDLGFDSKSFLFTIFG